MKTVKFFLALTAILFNSLLWSQTAIDWEITTGIEEQGEGFIKIEENGWNNNIAQSKEYINSSYCFAFDLSQVEWSEESDFKIALDESEQTEIDNSAYVVHFVNGEMHIEDGGSNSYTISQSPDIKIQITSSTVELLDGSQVIHTFSSGFQGSQVYTYLSMYYVGSYLPISGTECTAISTYIPPPSLPCTAIANYNYIESKTYAPDGTQLSGSVEIKDNFGKPLQVQNREFENNIILGKEVIYDRYGRASLETFPAPLGGPEYCYDEDFIKPTDEIISANEHYNYNHFDLKNTAAAAYGEENNPVEVSEYSTLGAYYNGTNPNISTTEFPYVRKHYTNDLLGEVTRASGYNSTFVSGSGNNTITFKTLSGNELEYVYGFLGSYQMKDQVSMDNYNLKLFKTITRLPDGQTQVTYENSEGGVVATCLSGSGGACITQKSRQQMISKVQSLVHIPASKTGSLQIRYPDPAGWYDNFTTNTSYCTSCFEITFYDKINNYQLVEGTDYNLVHNSATDMRIYDVVLLGNYASQESVLGISYKMTAQGETVFNDFRGFNYISLDPVIINKLDYYNWQLNYYDAFGQLTRSVQPEGVNCSYDAGLSFWEMDRQRAQAINKTSATPLYSLDVETNPGNVNKLNMAFYPFGVYEYRPPAAYGNEANPYYINSHTSGGGQGGGSSRTPTIEESEVSFPTIDQYLNDLKKSNEISLWADSQNYNSDGSQNKSKQLPGLPEEWEEDATEIRRFKMVHSGDIVVKGVAANGNETLLTTKSFRIEELLNQYLVETGVSGRKDVFENVTYKRYFGGAAISKNNIYTFDKYEKINEGLDNYVSVRVYVENVSQYEFPHFYACQNCSGAASTPPPTKSITFFNFIGILGHKFSSSPSAIQHKSLVEDYTYNDLGRLIEQDLPDEGTAQFIYSDDGKLRFSQDAQQLIDNEFSYTNYDRSGRPIESGVYRNNPAQYPPGATLIAMQFTRDEPATILATNLHYVKNDMDGLNDDNCFEVGYTFYDRSPGDLPASISSSFEQHYLRGQVAKSWNAFSTSWYSYDHMGNVEWIAMETPELGVKTIRYNYDQIGTLLSVDYNELSTTDDYYIKYQYDANYRLIGLFASDDPVTHYKKIASYEYDILGNLTRKVLGNDYQGLDYFYTTKGALKSINNAHYPSQDISEDGLNMAENTFFTDLFAETLTYYDGDFKNEGSYIQSASHGTLDNRYDGLVKAATWYNGTGITLSNNVGARPSYNLSYDEKGQLEEAMFGNYTAGTQNDGAGGYTAPSFTAAVNNTYKVQYAYDLNGNIKTLNRKAWGAITPMDNLTYNYPMNGTDLAGNAITHVDDAITGTNYGNELKDQAAGNYTYDALGRLVSDAQRDVYIYYNSQGLVSKVQNATQTLNRESTVYNERGQAIKKQEYDASGVLQKITYRVYDAGGQLLAEYEDQSGPVLTKTFVHGIEKAATAIHSASSEPDYHYEIKDHIGNVRTVFTNTATTTLQTTFTTTLDGWSLRASTTTDFTNNELKLTTDLRGGIYKVFDNLPTGSRYTVNVQVNEIAAQQVKVAVLDMNNGNAILLNKVLSTGYNQLSFNNINTTKIAVHVYVPVNYEAAGSYFTLKDVEITEEYLEILSYTDYYPFGWEMPGRQYVSAATDNEYGYSGDFSRKNEALAWNEFQFRNYDSRLGRWLSPDPAGQYHSPYMAMGNNPISVYDPTGLWGYKNDEGDIIWVNNMTRDWFYVDGVLYELVATNLEDIFDLAGLSGFDVYDATDSDGHDITLSSSDKLYEAEVPEERILEAELLIVKNRLLNPGENIMSNQLYENKGTLDYVHDGLDGAGVVPVFGEAADGINAAIYLVEGDYENAAFSGSAMVPFMGWGATGAKWAKKGLNNVHYKKLDPNSSAGWKSLDPTDKSHYFSNIVDNNMSQAAKFTIKGGDGVYRSLYQLQGSLRGRDGIFEWMIETGGNATHRVFIPNAKISGIPNNW